MCGDTRYSTTPGGPHPFPSLAPHREAGVDTHASKPHQHHNVPRLHALAIIMPQDESDPHGWGSERHLGVLDNLVGGRPTAQGLGHARGIGRLHSDDSHLRPHRLDVGGDSGEEPAPTATHEYGI